MRAVLLRGYGGVDQLEYQEVPDPIPHAGEVLVRMISGSVNPVDYKIREGAMKEKMQLHFPVILGRDVSGEIVGTAEGVTKFKVGDRVMGLVNHSYAELLRCSVEALTLIPEGLNVGDAGALPLVTITGAQLMERGVQPKSGETALVTGAAGSVGRTAVYVAKQHGCKVIAGVKASQKSDAAALGADQVVALDDQSEVSALPELDAIADTVDGETIGKLLSKLKKSGRLASVLGKPDAAKNAGVEIREVWAQPDPERLHQLASDVRDKKFSIPIAKRFSLAQIREAHEAAEKGASGKVVLTP